MFFRPGGRVGEYTTFSCDSCGYRVERIRWGVGLTDPRQRLLPALCPECRTIVEVDLTGRDVLIEEFRCGVCGVLVSFFEKGRSYHCPECQAPDLKIRQEGYW